MMNIEEVIQFFGHSAQSKEFDEYLTAHGISYRPIFEGIPVDDINVESSGLSLVFSTAYSYERRYSPPRDDGSMILSSLQIYSAENASGFEQYPGPLPYGLSFGSTIAEAMRIFGKSTVTYKFGEATSHVWHGYKGDTIGITFRAKDRGISWLELSRAAKWPPVQANFD